MNYVYLGKPINQRIKLPKEKVARTNKALKYLHFWAKRRKEVRLRVRAIRAAQLGNYSLIENSFLFFVIYLGTYSRMPRNLFRCFRHNATLAIRPTATNKYAIEPLIFTIRGQSPLAARIFNSQQLCSDFKRKGPEI